MQAYIEAENMRLELEACQFSSKEITIRIEYKYCPNLTIIDTPGLIAPAPGRKNRTLQVESQLWKCFTNIFFRFCFFNFFPLVFSFFFTLFGLTCTITDEFCGPAHDRVKPVRWRDRKSVV